MNTPKHLSHLGVAALAAAGLLTMPRTVHAEKPEVVPGPAKPVIVENSDPIAIEGEVDATIQGTVPVTVENTDPIAVEGSVTIDSPLPLPVEGEVDATVLNTVEVEGTVEVQDFNTQLDDLKSEVQQVQSAVESLNLPKKANRSFVEYHTMAAGASVGSAWGSLDETFYASLITVTPENDTLVIEFFEDGSCSGYPVLRFGAKDASFTRSLVVPIPNPLAIHCYSIRCHNAFEDCEVAVTVTGRWEEPAP